MDVGKGNVSKPKKLVGSTDLFRLTNRLLGFWSLSMIDFYQLLNARLISIGLG